MNECEQNGESRVRQREPVEASPKQSSQIGILGLKNNAHMGNFFRSGDVFNKVEQSQSYIFPLIIFAGEAYEI